MNVGGVDFQCQREGLRRRLRAPNVGATLKALGCLVMSRGEPRSVSLSSLQSREDSNGRLRLVLASRTTPTESDAQLAKVRADGATAEHRRDERLDERRGERARVDLPSGEDQAVVVLVVRAS